MRTLPIDDGLMYCAISDVSHVGGPEETAYLNLRTGEIRFLPKSISEGLAWGSPDRTGPKIAGERAAIENRASDWAEIPKFDGRFAGDQSEDEFIREFLAEHGIEWKVG
jgi:hypothetical protein